MADRRLPDPVFLRLKAMVIRRTLHHYYENKDALLRERLLRRLDATGLDGPSYLALLEGAPGSDAEWETLEGDITIGETFFFRFAEQFAVLENHILPGLLRERAATRRLSIWSAGCSTGAEPYSVAILLHRLLGPALADWSISILGTDISEAALEVARRAEYGGWALRTLHDHERRRDFVPAPATAGGSGRWLLRPAYRRMVCFERQNLLDLLDGAPAERFDLVLCRNVLIYFHAECVQALVRRFGECLAPDGWLLLGHAEAASLAPAGLRAESLDGTVVWRRAEARPPPPGPVPPPAGAKPVRRAASMPFRPRPAAGPVPNAEPAPPPTPPDVVAAVRALADAGRNEAALSLCRQALDQSPPQPELFFYAALLNRAANRPNDAEADFRRAIYLCKHFAMAHYHLGLLLLDAGRLAHGRRAIAEAGRIAAAMPADAALDCGDGITAGRLHELSRFDWLGDARAAS